MYDLEANGGPAAVDRPKGSSLVVLVVSNQESGSAILDAEMREAHYREAQYRVALPSPGSDSTEGLAF